MRNLLDCLNLISQTTPQTQDAVRAAEPLNALELVEQIQFAALSAAAMLKQELNSQFPDGLARVLLVEPDAVRRAEIADQLRSVDILVAEVSDGIQAIEYLYEMPQPDVIITDLVMPDCDGWELINVARTSRVGLGVLMVAVTNHATSERALPDLDLLMPKQVCATQLATQVRQLIERQSSHTRRTSEKPLV